MPILRAEPDCNPPNLWDGYAPPPAEEEYRWWCLHTKPRQEKATARELRKAGIAFYLPQYLRESRTPQGRKISSIVPLFAGYMFLNGTSEHRLLAIRAHRLVNVLEVVDQEGLARDLRQIHTMVTSGLPVFAETGVPVGATVRIATGPLAGTTGKVIRRGKRDQFVAVVHFLGRGATVDLRDWQVERVDE
jgi:transcriptional antiterminator RfaH